MHVGKLLALAIGCALGASAQPVGLPENPRRISLKECVELALSRNLDLQIEHLSSEIARDNLSSSYGAFVPNFSFSARHDSVSQPLDFDPHKANPDFPYDLSSDKGRIGLDGRLPFGLSYDLSGLAGKKEATTDFNAVTNVANDYFFGTRHTNNYFASSGLTLQQHLLKDFWINQDWQTVLLRRRDLKISQELLRLQIMKTVLAVELGYYELLASHQRIRVAEQTLELKQQLVKEMQRRVQVGDLPPLDSEQAQTQLQNALATLAAAREDFFDRQNALKILFTDSFEAWANIDLEPVDTLEAPVVEPNRSESFRKALKDRPDLAEARLVVEKNDVLVRFRLNQLFPSLDLIGHYGSDAVEPDSTRSAINEAIRFRDPSYFYGATVSFPLSQFAERSSYNASKAAKQIAELQLKRAEQEVLMQVSLWVHRVQSRFSQVGYTRKARSYAESALTAEEKKLQNGLSTTFMVLQLQEDLTNARSAEIQALADYNKALAQLAFSEGSIMEKNRLMLEVK